MDTIITPGARSNINSTNSNDMNSVDTGPNVTQSTGYASDSIQVTASISDGVVSEDGNLTPTAMTINKAGVFENGVLAPTIHQSYGLLDGSSGLLSDDGQASNINNPSFSLTQATTEDTAISENNSNSPLPIMLGANGQTQQPQTQQQQQQQQQRQRELHYESANAVLVPPLNFAMVAPGVYRSGHPNKHNFPFMRKLGLKVIVQMSEEPYAPELEEFLEREHIRRIHYKIEGNKEPFIEIDEQVISSALVNILDVRNHPLLIHCAKGKHRIGCLIGCLRKIQNWSMTSIFDEYRRFAGSKVLADQEFIEIFAAKVPFVREHKPFWLDT
ncbi:hypothetical protein EDD11_008394 [Mortierella claussenii]|nr:hypothetical protein EDD11_008394 [Mortierella claussenii]